MCYECVRLGSSSSPESGTQPLSWATSIAACLDRCSSVSVRCWYVPTCADISPCFQRPPFRFTFLSNVFLKGNQVQKLLSSIFSAPTQQLCESYGCVMKTTSGMEKQGHALWQKFYANMPLDRWDGLDWGS